MKKSLRRVSLSVLTGALVLGGAMVANAQSLGQGQWLKSESGEHAGDYWFTVDPDGKKCIANTWHWVKDNDGKIRCYYFDANGWVVKNTVIDGATVDADGRWVENGQVVEAAEGEKDYYEHSSTFISALRPKTEEQAPAQGQTNATKPNKVVSKGQGDNPASAQADALGYAISDVNGYVATNNWANYSINFGSIARPVTKGTAEDGIDLYVTDGGSELTIRYVPLSYYKAGNTDVNAFAASYLADKREGMTGGKIDADIQLGAYTFKQITKKAPHPQFELYDHTYIRPVEGTSYAQVITVKQNGYEQDFLSALNTIAKVR
ncbi:MAG: hypothetical protein Q4B86_03705 [Eubacteriales bacterium]|nr:hypothetical protein [Eubacteriales bacterium]